MDSSTIGSYMKAVTGEMSIEQLTSARDELGELPSGPVKSEILDDIASRIRIANVLGDIPLEDVEAIPVDSVDVGDITPENTADSADNADPAED